MIGLIGGSALGAGILSGLGQSSANRANRKEAQKNRDFQERMSSTAHQREVVDLRAAGLNPILSGVGGSGAATSAGSMATQSDALTPAVSTAMEAMRNKEEVKLLTAQELKATVETKTSAQHGVLYSQQQDEALANTGLLTEMIKKIKEDTGTAAALRRTAENDAAESDIRQEAVQAPGEKQRQIIDRWLKTIGIGTGSARDVAPYRKR